MPNVIFRKAERHISTVRLASFALRVTPLCWEQLGVLFENWLGKFHQNVPHDPADGLFDRGEFVGGKIAGNLLQRRIDACIGVVRGVEEGGCGCWVRNHCRV